MSTHAYIGIENEDATVSYIYNHHDGYINGLGNELLTNYNTPEAARTLVDGGDCRFPGDAYFGRPGEEWENIKPKIEVNVDDFFDEIGSMYAYLFSASTNSWVVRRPRSAVCVGLRRALEKNL
jgi:hypothetical protein